MRLAVTGRLLGLGGPGSLCGHGHADKVEVLDDLEGEGVNEDGAAELQRRLDGDVDEQCGRHGGRRRKVGAEQACSGGANPRVRIEQEVDDVAPQAVVGGQIGAAGGVQARDAEDGLVDGPPRRRLGRSIVVVSTLR